MNLHTSEQKKQVNVDIIGETSKSYKVRYKEFHTNGQKPGYITWVSKTSIKQNGNRKKPA
jgi:hypothetical protein